VCEGGRGTLGAPSFSGWRIAAERYMTDRPEAAGYSVQGATPVTFLSGRTADLIGLSSASHQTSCARSQLQEWMAAAARKGLVHHVAGPDDDESAAVRGTISVGIDAAWLGGGESGAQVAATELIRGLAVRAEIDRVTLISDSGRVPANLQGIAKVGGASWSDVLARDTPSVDILHRPYQPGIDVDFRRYHQAAKCVALTVLDFIAYDNPNYHESDWAWRRYQQVFDEHVCLADCVFAISQSVATRLERQFAHQLAGRVHPTLLGTDHVRSIDKADAEPRPEIRALENERFLVVLGNDFEHKNRDFAVRVFADMCERGYDGRLVLAGFHLDLGSSFGHELQGAGAHGSRIVRLGSVSRDEKRRLLQRSEVVLYPTSAEGFGLVPFEAAALGTPTAFVKFGPLAETLPDVDACGAWQVRAFADHVFRLLADPERQVAQIRAPGARLTWSSYVDQVLSGYQNLLSPAAPWRTRGRHLPTWQTRLQRAADEFAYRARNKLRRLAGKTS
jgi:glycosyltransferase involved in cell wall biosynthesis